MTSPAPALRPGDQLASTACTTQVAVIRAPAQGRPLIACGGEPMVPAAAARPPGSHGPGSNGTDAATLIGKRYTDAAETVELLCTSSGAALLFITSAVGGTCLAVLADPEADAGLIAYEMAMLVKRVGQHMVASPRFPAPHASSW